MATRIRLDYCGMAGEGATVREAKADAARKLTALVQDLESGPRLVRFGACASLIYRDARGWVTVLLDSEGSAKPSGPIYGSSHGHESLDDALVSAARHVAQLEWRKTVPSDAEFFRAALEAARLAPRLRPTLLRDLMDWANWQRRYAALAAEGLDDAAIRERMWEERV